MTVSGLHPEQSQAYEVILTSSVATDIHEQIDDVEEKAFADRYLSLALNLGGDWNDAIELRDSAEGEIKYGRIMKLITGVQTELTGCVSNTTRTLEIDGRQYFVTRLALGAEVVYRPLTTLEIAATNVPVFEKAREYGKCVFLLLNIDLSPETA